MKKSLVSAWTQALAYQTFRSLADAIRPVDAALGAELDMLAVTVKDAFEHLLIKDGVIAGFVEYKDSCEYLLHPCDKRTGIHYRLLPMTRSIISELVDSKQAGKNIALITEHLKCPDGVRLMDKPANYDGSVSTLFKRAEQAVNVGREICLQYTHIRYLESMAKSENGEEAWNSLFTVNPILIWKSVPNARIRQLIANVLGICFCEKGLILDPVISTISIQRMAQSTQFPADPVFRQRSSQIRTAEEVSCLQKML